VPVVPVAVNTGYFWPKHTMRKTAGTAIVQFLEPCAPCGEDKESWVNDVKARIRAVQF
jgi:1-acyl-sn-glycerol-3-phosphate acyltransferase